MKLRDLHEEFIEQSRRPMVFGKLPIRTREAEAPIIAVDQWREVGSKKILTKGFKFRVIDDRNFFVRKIFKHEEEVQHPVTMIIDGDTVTIGLITHGIDQITESDKEFASFADSLFKDIVYSVRHER
jgi:pterin-4a-carbinolamine dehydratase